MMNVKFQWNGIKVDGELYRCYYTKGPYTATSKIPEGTITLYAKDYSRFPAVEGIHVENESDIMTDYFETDRIRIFPGTKYYDEACKALKAHEIHTAKNALKHFEKQYQKHVGTRHEGFYQKELEASRQRLEALTA